MPEVASVEGAAQPGLAAAEARDRQLGTCIDRGTPSFLAVLTIPKGFAAEAQDVGQRGVAQRALGRR
jgi:hypothetical protein